MFPKFVVKSSLIQSLAELLKFLLMSPLCPLLVRNCLLQCTAHKHVPFMLIPMDCERLQYCIYIRDLKQGFWDP